MPKKLMIMQSFLLIIIQFFKFWFVDAPKGIVDYFLSLNTAMLRFFSLGILLKTFFKPWKNEYRQGFVGFAIIMGMVIKSMIIVFNVALFGMFIVFEIVLLFLFICWPVITIGLLFI